MNWIRCRFVDCRYIARAVDLAAAAAVVAVAVAVAAVAVAVAVAVAAAAAVAVVAEQSIAIAAGYQRFAEPRIAAEYEGAESQRSP